MRVQPTDLIGPKFENLHSLVS